MHGLVSGLPVVLRGLSRVKRGTRPAKRRHRTGIHGRDEDDEAPEKTQRSRPGTTPTRAWHGGIGVANAVDGGGAVRRPSLNDLIATANAGQRGLRGRSTDASIAGESAQGRPLARPESGAVTATGSSRKCRAWSQFETGRGSGLALNSATSTRWIKLDGQAIVADVISLNQLDAVGLISSRTSAGTPGRRTTP